MSSLCHRLCCPRPARLQAFGRSYCSQTCADAHVRFLAQQEYEMVVLNGGQRVFFEFDAGGRTWYFLAFYYPDEDTEWDKRCHSGFLGNFYPLETELWMALGGRNCCFQTAEAAFQALKYAHDPGIVESFASYVKGDEAVRLNSALRLQPIAYDQTYGGRVCNWLAMWEVLQRKFLHTGLQDRLLKTGDCFLLEHNKSPHTKDDTWSDKHDGTGKNWLGMQLMLLRDHLRKQRGESPSHWEGFLLRAVDMNTGQSNDPASYAFWQTMVQNAAAEVNRWMATQGAALSRQRTGGAASMAHRSTAATSVDPQSTKHAPKSKRVTWAWLGA